MESLRKGIETAKEKRIIDLIIALGEAFVWEHTSQRHNYWEAVSDNLGKVLIETAEIERKKEIRKKEIAEEEKKERKEKALQVLDELRDLIE